MTRAEYENQWKRVFTKLTKDPMPSYKEFSVSERMLEDYLDIFRGVNSRDGNIAMPYEHPFFDKNGEPLLKEKPFVKYILLGEARPPLKDAKLNQCGGDKDNTYFYDIRHVKHTAYLSQPRKYWDCPKERPCPGNKVGTLLCLASKGVLLLDLFCYAIRYTTTLRDKLNNKGITRLFWDNPMNPYNLHERIMRLSSLLSDDWDLTCIAPCKISEHIVNPINAFPTLAISPVGLHPTKFRCISFDKSRCSSSKNGHEWRKIAMSQQSPTARLIGLSF